MPRHARVDDEIFIRMLERAQAVVDLPVNLGVRFHVLVELEGRHAHFGGDLPLNGARGVHLRTQLLRQDFADRRFAAAQVARERNFETHSRFSFKKNYRAIVPQIAQNVN